MKVLLVGEGASELAGSLETLVRRLREADDEIDQDRVSRRGIHAHHGTGQGYFKRAIRWMLEAQKRGYDALILVIDQDGNRERTKEFDRAQLYEGIAFRRALGVAIRTFDAWMLADEKALTSVLGYRVSRQPDPETVNEPKHVCDQLLRTSSQSLNRAEMYAAVADATDIAVLHERCRDGFSPFAQRIQAL